MTNNTNTNQTWHIECLHCGDRHYEAMTVVHNAGYDWEDASSWCPACGLPSETSSDYVMHDGRI